MKIFSPTYHVTNVLSLDENFFKKTKTTALILDLDNTLSMHNNPNYEVGICEWLIETKNLGVKLVIASNNKYLRVKPIADMLGLPFVHLTCKPLVLKKGLKRAWEILGHPEKSEVMIVGDQIFTDVLAGKFFGVRSVLVEPFELEDNFPFKCKRVIEKMVYRGVANDMGF